MESVVSQKKRDKDVDEFPVGSLVMTPSGRVAVVTKHIWGDRDHGDFARCLVRYLDSADERECCRIVPTLLNLLVAGRIFRKAIESWRGSNDDEDKDES